MVIHIPDETFLKCAHITIAYFLVLALTQLYQGSLRIRVFLKHQKNKSVHETKQKYMRYGHEDLLAADRCIGNFVEWMGPFMGVFWLNAILDGQYVELGWVYVASRILYPFIAVGLNGITSSGPDPIMYLATTPGYLVIGFYAYRVFRIFYLS